jgi:ubiquinone/menaquinone biosynthesis C-methylase UbiE
MLRIEPFEKFPDDYENWFERNHSLYLSELELIKLLWEEGPKGKSLEVGVGSGRFALPLGVDYGIDPSFQMLKISHRKGLKVCRAIAEELPFKNNTFKKVLMITTICFVNNPIMSIKEVERVLSHPDGIFIIGYIDKNSFLGKKYLQRKNKSKFYRLATFYSTEEIIELVLKNTSLKLCKALQTIYSEENIFHPPTILNIEKGKPINLKGAFIGLKFCK